MKVATVLTVYGIETSKDSKKLSRCLPLVATVLTVYGIETLYVAEMEALAAFRLQQYLPLAVLKQFFICFFNLTSS